jgi:hypothetical protein
MVEGFVWIWLFQIETARNFLSIFSRKNNLDSKFCLVINKRWCMFFLSQVVFCKEERKVRNENLNFFRSNIAQYAFEPIEFPIWKLERASISISMIYHNDFFDWPHYTLIGTLKDEKKETYLVEIYFDYEFAKVKRESWKMS